MAIVSDFPAEKKKLAFYNGVICLPRHKDIKYILTFKLYDVWILMMWILTTYMENSLKKFPFCDIQLINRMHYRYVNHFKVSATLITDFNITGEYIA